MNVNTSQNSRPLAVFDLDGTLTRRDSFLPFLLSYPRQQGRLGPRLRLPFCLGAYLCRLSTDAQAKQYLLRRFLGGESLIHIQRHADHFSRHWLPRHPHALGMQKLREHQQAGHRIILLSASPDVYVPTLAKQLGITEVVCTRVAVQDGQCVGDLVEGNCKGKNKLKFLQRYLGQDHAPAESYAYGDSKSDLPVLEWISEGFLVSPGTMISVSASTS